MKLKSVFFSIWFLALIIAIPAIVLFPPVFEKYKVELKTKDVKVNPSSILFYNDLNNDAQAERIEAYQAPGSIFSFQCFNSNNVLIDQYNFPYQYNNRLSKIFFADLDNNQLKEVYGFTQHEDSVFLSWIEPMNSIHQFKSRFITTINTEKRKELDASVKEIEFFDFDGDGNAEIVFSIEVGYNWFPRQMFVYHPDEDRLQKSENFGVHFSAINFLDLNNDGKFELFCNASSAENIPDNFEIKYLDDRPRIFVFDSDLNVIGQPLEFPSGLGSYAHSFITDSVKGELITLYHNFSSKNTGTFLVKTHLKESFCTDTIFFPIEWGGKIKLFKENENTYWVASLNGKICKINTQMEIVNSLNLKYTTDHFLIGIDDIYKDGNPEYYFAPVENNSILIYFDNFKRKIELEFDETITTQRMVKSPNQNEFVVVGQIYNYYYTIYRNKFFFLKYLVYILLYAVSALFIWLVQYARIRQFAEKQALQNQVIELQIRAMKNQLDPHFVFNTFNTIASVIKQGRNEEAYDVMVQFSKLVRNNMDTSNEIYNSLKKELNFIKDYLYIQRFRFSEHFDYQIKTDKNVNMKIEIPKMLLQIHVENALKHGLRNAKKKGLLLIRILSHLKGIKIEIEDNGIGREKSRLNNGNNTGTGLKTVQQIIEYNNKKDKTKISQEIIDLKDKNGIACGTKIILILS